MKLLNIGLIGTLVENLRKKNSEVIICFYSLFFDQKFVYQSVNSKLLQEY